MSETNGLRVYRSNRLDVLVTVLAEQLRVGSTDPFAPLEVVVGSRGMERHLRQALAERLGICAHVTFPFPTAALDALDPHYRRDGTDPWSTGAMTWALLECLPSVAASEVGAPLRSYLGDAFTAPTVGARTWGLAQRLADMLDGYVTYRPEWVADWDAGRSGRLQPPKWQVALWQALRAQLQDAPHRSERLLGLRTLSPSASPLHVFGLSGLAGSWLRAIGSVSQSRPVDLYLLGPSHQYWADLGRRVREVPGLSQVHRPEVDDKLIDTPDIAAALSDQGHPLLHAWGRTGRDLQILLEEAPEGFEDQRTDLFIDPAPEPGPSALKQLQHDVLHAMHPRERAGFDQRVFATTDASVQFHACHGATRQVEVLRTVLLELLGKEGTTLQPRDIVVMTPDIDSYAPRIGAVFGAGEAHYGADGWLPCGSPRLRWELADLTVRRVNPVADALLRVVEMVEGRAKASEVLALLALEPVAQLFEIAPEDLTTVQGWVVQSGIRWGADATSRSHHDQPEDPQNTWRFGLERLLMGVLMTEGDRLPGGVRPFESVEGGATQLVGRFAHFCGTLFDQLDRLRAPRAVADWCEQLAQCVEALTRTATRSAWLTRSVRQALADLAAEAEAAGSEAIVAVDAIRASLVRRFDAASSAHHGTGGAITFCGMVPERAVPYRVVCLLGMDEGSFPRVGTRPAFDLLQQHPRVGDRNTRDEDRYLLLEALLSARDTLVVLYSGRDVRTNEELPPAVPVSELFDALDATWPHDGKSLPHQALLTQHPLQAFDQRNFGRDEEPFSYDAQLLKGVRAAAATRTPAPPFLTLASDCALPAVEIEDVDLQKVVHFWRHPLRSYLQNSLSIYLDRDDTLDVPDREPLELGWLENRALVSTLIEARSQGLDSAAAQTALEARGQLPLGGAGAVVFSNLEQLASKMMATARDTIGWGPSTHEDVGIDVDVGGIRLVGHVPGVCRGGLVRFFYGTKRESDLLEVWAELLALRAQVPAHPARALLVYGTVKDDGEVTLKPIGLDATQLDDRGLADLHHRLTLSQSGLHQPLPFFPKTSHAIAKALRQKKNGLPAEWQHPSRLSEDDLSPVAGVLLRARTEADSKWLGGFSKGEGDDRYYRHAFGDQRPYLTPEGDLSRAVLTLAARCWWPVITGERTRAKIKGWVPA